MPETLRPILDLSKEDAYRCVYAALSGQVRHKVPLTMWDNLETVEPFFDELSFHGVHERKYRYGKRLYSVLMNKDGTPYTIERVVKMKPPPPENTLRVIEFWTARYNNGTGFWPIEQGHDHHGKPHKTKAEALAAVKASKRQRNCKHEVEHVTMTFETFKV